MRISRVRAPALPRLLFPGCRWRCIAGGRDAELLRRAGPAFGQFADLPGLLAGQVAGLRAVGSHIVEFPRPGSALGHEFPVAHADGAIARVAPPQILVRDGPVARQGRHKTYPGRRRNGFAFPLLRPATAGRRCPSMHAHADCGPPRRAGCGHAIRRGGSPAPTACRTVSSWPRPSPCRSRSRFPRCCSSDTPGPRATLPWAGKNPGSRQRPRCL